MIEEYERYCEQEEPEGETRGMLDIIQKLYEALSVFVNMDTDYGGTYYISCETMERASEALSLVPGKWLPKGGE